MSAIGIAVLASCASTQTAPIGPVIAITVDDLPVHGPLPRGTKPVEVARSFVTALQQEGISSAYGFINGRWTKTDPETFEILKEWRSAGFPVGNHTWSHPNLNDLSVEAYRREIANNEALLEELWPKGDWRWFRYPFLAEGNDANKRAEVRELLASRRYRIAAVTMDFSDWQWSAPYARCKDTGNEAAIAKLEDSYLQSARENIAFFRLLSRWLYKRDIPYVLLMHIGAFDARMLPRLLALYRADGFRFVTLAEAQSDVVYQADLDPAMPARVQSLEGRAAAKGITLPSRTNFAPFLEAICKQPPAN